MYMYFLLMHTDQDEKACGMSCTWTPATILIGYLTEPVGPSGPRGNVKLKNGKQCVIVCSKKQGKCYAKCNYLRLIAL